MSAAPLDGVQDAANMPLADEPQQVRGDLDDGSRARGYLNDLRGDVDRHR